MLKLNFFKEFQTLAEVLAQLYPKETEIFRFIHAQQLTEEKQLRSNIKDENTLELFWALKLYAMAKIDQLKE